MVKDLPEIAQGVRAEANPQGLALGFRGEIDLNVAHVGPHFHGPRRGLEEGRASLLCPLGEGHKGPRAHSSGRGSWVNPGSYVTQRWVPMASLLHPTTRGQLCLRAPEWLVQDQKRCLVTTRGSSQLRPPGWSGS